MRLPTRHSCDVSVDWLCVFPTPTTGGDYFTQAEGLVLFSEGLVRIILLCAPHLETGGVPQCMLTTRLQGLLCPGWLTRGFSALLTAYQAGLWDGYTTHLL